MSLMGYICESCHAYHPIVDGVDPCRKQETLEFINGCFKDQPHEIVAEHLPGKPVFRTRGQRDRYFKRHNLVAYGKSDLSSLKTQVARSGGRGKPVHDLKAWWRQEAAKYRGLVDRPAFISR